MRRITAGYLFSPTGIGENLKRILGVLGLEKEVPGCYADGKWMKGITSPVHVIFREIAVSEATSA